MSNDATIIVTAYNQSKFIEETLASVFYQTCQNFDVIITNDGSTDDTLEKIAGFISKKDIKQNVTILNTDDIGATLCRHQAIQKSNTKYYVPVDGDDVLDSRFLERTIPYLEKNKDFAFVYTDCTYFGEQNIEFNLPEYNFYNLIFQNYMCYASLFSREAYEACGGYNLKNRNYYEDWELSIRMGKNGFYGKHLHGKLFYYRTHKESSSYDLGYLDKVYRQYIITQYQELYPPKMFEEAVIFMKKYPDNFMDMRRKDQIKVLDEQLRMG